LLEGGYFYLGVAIYHRPRRKETHHAGRLAGCSPNSASCER
jgi:hypothetical protein